MHRLQGAHHGVRLLRHPGRLLVVVVGLDHLLSISLGRVPENLVDLVLLALLQLMLNDLLAEARRVLGRSSIRLLLLLILILRLLKILHHETASIDLRLLQIRLNFLRSYLLDVV
jgi:hypothetical protein